MIDDVGSGALWDFGRYGIRGEPQVAESIRAGADVVLFSGDKLLGGPQCGVIVGKAAYVDVIRRHPLARALRVDKMTLAALDATLQIYLDPDRAEQRLPLLQLLSTSADNLKYRAEQLAPQIARTPLVASADVASGTAYLGGGSMPQRGLATWCVVVRPEGLKVEELARRLRTGRIAVFGRVQDDRLWLDLRAVFPGEDARIVEAFEEAGRPEEDGEAITGTAPAGPTPAPSPSDGA